ncbi:hypothetical protein BDV96DRAFT_596175 [Lophiotrema nucula]|uniref:Uncharacterized protein n=1 Tax=Lophiotrema nucula TaxID=690887 RepID=A0A6A5ZK02_9PLEO|nr:hypothetical protein BDV96DRAFT_596175 [Lophiotrema nucula]
MPTVSNFGDIAALSGGYAARKRRHWRCSPSIQAHLHDAPTNGEAAHRTFSHAAELAAMCSTQANSKNQVYFMWDFILRTFQHLAAQVDPRSPYDSRMFEDVLERTEAAQSLILDPTGNMLKSMNASVGYADDVGVEFSEEIEAMAKELDQPPKGGCANYAKDKKEDGREVLLGQLSEELLEDAQEGMQACCDELAVAPSFDHTVRRAYATLSPVPLESATVQLMLSLGLGVRSYGELFQSIRVESCVTRFSYIFAKIHQ